MKGENIICFSKDWAEDPTSNHHVMRELAKGNRVLWLNSVATRTPKLSSGRDVGKIFRKLREFARGPKKVAEGLWVFTPLVLPLPHSRAARAINKPILQATIWALRKKLGMDRFQLWTFLPNVGEYVGELGESLVVYYCVDEWALFSYIDAAPTIAAEQELCERADVIFATSEALVERKRALNPQTFHAPHGVDHELFARALDDDTVVPAELARLPHPRLGFYGTIQDWIDYPLLEALASRHPEWSIVLIGSELVDVSALRRYPNVHFLGRKRHAELPAYCKGFDVALIPYTVGERTRYVNPIKLREYLSAGLPVVSTALPEVSRYAEHCRVAHDIDSFERHIVEVLAQETPDKRRARSQAMCDESWPQKVVRVSERVEETKRKRWRAA
ncbi:MAG TPA: glycosyltransferase [Polyangiaceae bacterium]|jgi:glycosyltransferase involved in cell wall biosynthesis|nr:glycosyltransferase [Polyangiaceae bacterium]